MTWSEGFKIELKHCCFWPSLDSYSEGWLFVFLLNHYVIFSPIIVSTVDKLPFLDITTVF